MPSTTNTPSAPPAARVGPAEVRLAALALVTVLVGYACWLLARPFFGALTWAGVLALVTHPIHRWIGARVTRRNLAAGLAVAVVTLAIVIPVVAVGAFVVREANKGAQTLSAGELRARWEGLKRSNPRLAPVLDRIERELGIGAPASAGVATGGTPAEGGQEGRRGVLFNTVRAGAEFLITLLALFFFFRDSEAVKGAARDLLPMTRRRADRILQRVADTVWATTYGTLVVAGIQGLLGGLMFWWLGLPVPVLWGVVMGLLALVPVLGAFIVWVPAAVFLGLEGSWGKALLLAGWGAIVIGLVDNILYPSLVGGRLRLHTLVVFIAMVGGLSVFGAAGLFLGPALVTLALELRRVWRVRGRRGMASAVGGVALGSRR
jgi:predicted PurR-regulated permease PerM